MRLPDPPPELPTAGQCAAAINCPGSDSPLSNYSSEAPDPLVFFCYSWSAPATRIGIQPGPGCASIVTSTVSQQDACTLARTVSQSITQLGGPCPDPGPPPDNPGPANPGDPVVPGNPIGPVVPGHPGFPAGRMSLNGISPEWCAGQYDADNITVSRAVGGVSFYSTYGSLPNGLGFDTSVPNQLVIKGTPVAPGNYSVGIVAIDSIGRRASRQYNLSVMGLTTALPLPAATVGLLYYQAIYAGGGSGFFTFSADPAMIPSWLTVTPDGFIRGTPGPTDSGIDFTFDITITDHFDLGPTFGQSCTVTVSVWVGYNTVTPDIMSATVSLFNDGQPFPPGTYRIGYVKGAMKYNGAYGWALNPAQSSSDKFLVSYNNGATTAAFPGTASDFPTQAAVESANAGAGIAINHAGGTIGVFLSDAIYADNVAGAPNPTFSITLIP